MAKIVKEVTEKIGTYTIETIGSIQIGHKIIRSGVPTEISKDEMEVMRANNFEFKTISTK